MIISNDSFYSRYEPFFQNIRQHTSPSFNLLNDSRKLEPYIPECIYRAIIQVKCKLIWLNLCKPKLVAFPNSVIGIKFHSEIARTLSVSFSTALICRSNPCSHAHS